jgi:Carbohydrate esterase, sialic acid-specific acetylesterase
MYSLFTRVSAGVVVVFIAFFLGGYSARQNIFPFPALMAAKALIIPPPPSRYAFDQAGRLVSDDQKSGIPCPQQTGRTAVLLLIGQSNAGNHGGQQFHSEHGEKVVNFFGGQCFVAASPLLGSDGTNGEYWTQLGNILVDSGAFDQVVLAPVTLSGSEISRWSRGGDLDALMINTAVQLQQFNYHVTHTLWDQGERDYVIGTSETIYYQKFISIVDSLRDHGITSPVFVSVASKCLASTCLGVSNGGTRFHSANNAIVRAQLALPNTQKGIRSGVNTDALLDELDRYDDCHFSSSGEQKVAKAWADLLLGDR